MNVFSDKLTELRIGNCVLAVKCDQCDDGQVLQKDWATWFDAVKAAKLAGEPMPPEPSQPAMRPCIYCNGTGAKMKEDGNSLLLFMLLAMPTIKESLKGRH